MNIAVIDDLERRYQTLVSDFQAGKIDETTFVSSVDQLQFQDESGRYWMMGAQTGTWHHYDGQTWHQADPRDADKLPFVDEQGRYWQRGARSGEWYYYQAETGEWVKPDQNDPSLPHPSQSRVERPSSAPYQSHLYPQSVGAGPDMPSQSDGELFQDDEGRYWMVGSKTGQWYFYDHDGWHPAHEFQYRTQAVQSYPYQSQPYEHQQTAHSYYPAQQPQAPYQPQPQAYTAAPQSAQFYPQPQQPVQQAAATPPPAQESVAAPATPETSAQPPQPQPVPPKSDALSTEAQTAPASVKPDASEVPNPPSDKSDSGAWYYFDGKQWLKYSSGEPADVPPPNPEMVLDQKAEPARSKSESQEKESVKEEEPVVVAELFEDEEEEPPAEIVDVEVITVIEAEPDTEPATAVPPEPSPEPASASVSPVTEEIRPRRATRPLERTEGQPSPTPVEPRRQSKERISAEPSRPVAPRKREAAHEPTIIIPTESAVSSIGSARATKPVKSGQPQQRRAREGTIPMETVTAAGSRAPADVTQPLPKTQPTRSDTDKVKVARDREDTKPDVVSTPKATAKPQKKAGYTFGEVLRAFPSTFWTLAIGLVVLLIFAVIIVIGYSMLQSSNLGVGSLAVGQSPTPTLGVAIADSTPTPGPTPEVTPEPLVTSAPPSTISFSSPTLGFSLEYPEEWYREEEELQIRFSPSADGLDVDSLNDVTMWIGQSANKTATIAEVLTELLAQFPSEAETLNQGTISIASQTWTSAQIGFEDESLGGQGIATLAVTSKDGIGYYLVAVASADQWNSAQPLFQGMINSFRFTSAEAVAQASSTETPDAGTESADEDTTPEPDSTEEPTVEPNIPSVEATPITYVVQSGDTLLGIAVKFDIDVDLLAAENDIGDPNDLRLGQELIIPFTEEELAAYLSGGGTTDAGAGGASGSEETPEATETSTEIPTETGPTPQPEPAQEAAPVSGRIVYPAFNPAINSYDIWLVDIAAGNQSIIAGNASQPAFNRDGSLLAYRSWDLGTRGIFFRDFVGGRGGQVTRFVEDGLPTWSPDGFSFAFASRREGDRVPRIYRGDQMGQSDFPVGFQGEYPSTFPDGRLVVKGCLPNGDCGLYIIGPNGGGETKISGEAGDTAPAVSPDGSKIAIMSSARGATNWEIWVMSPDGSNPQRLTENGSNDGLPAWSPDGQSIAFVSDQGGVWSVWVMNADGSNQRKLFNMNGSPDGIVLQAGNDSKGWLEERISWAP